jgi:ribosomal protein L11 methyltransferase
MAFGTGHHETTFLMLESLLVYMQKGMSVIDIGTGSGILAIASHQLGASYVLGTEFDPVCEENFNENLKLNNIESNVSYVTTNCLKWTDYSQDIILANINRNVIIDLLPKLKNSHGTIIISGVLITDEVVISKLCNDLNLSVISRKTKGEWMCLTLRKQCK